MVFGLRRPSRDAAPAGIEIGPGTVRVAQLATARRGERAELITASATCVRTPAAAARVARGLLDGNRFVGRRVVVALPDPLVHFRAVRLEPEPSDRAQAIRRQASEGLPFELSEQTAIQYWCVGQTRTAAAGPQDEFIVALSDPAKVRTFLDELADAGLDVVCADASICAAYRTAAIATPGTELREPGASVAVLRVGGERNSHLAVGLGPHIQHVRPIEIGGEHLADAVARRLGAAPHEAAQLRRRLHGAGASAARESVRRAVRQACRGPIEGLAEQVVASLRYHRVTFAGAGPQQLFLCGPEAGDHQLAEILRAATGLPCGPITRLPEYLRASAPTRENEDSSVAIGLALRYARPDVACGTARGSSLAA